MPFGLTSSGFIIKRLVDIKSELESLYRSVFGAGIKTTDDTVFGKLIGIQSEREAVLWELMQIGRASCRERGDGAWCAGVLKKGKQM